MALQNSSIWDMRTFLNGTYHIPDYQREYTWEGNELGDFWDDLEYTKNDSDKMAHFFGQIVIHNENGTKYIIDGQQRTITSVIFLRTLQILYSEIYKKSGNEDANDQQSEIASLIGRCNKKGNKLHLISNSVDGDYFRENIQLGQPKLDTKEKIRSHEHMRQAFAFFYRKLTEILAANAAEDEDSQVNYLDSYYETFVNRFEVLYMEATKLEEAFIIFETLNARGKDLETADLLKNYIFRQSKDVTLAQKKWNSMIEALGKADPTKYIRHFWNSNHEFERDKTLYRAISKEINTKKRSQDFLSDLATYAVWYHSMAFPEEEIEFQNKELVRSLKALKTLKAKSFYPVILAMAQAKFAEDDIALVVATIETYMFRNFTICGKVANESERFFAVTARAIYEKEQDTANDICKSIRDKIVSNEEFEAAFIKWSASKSEKEIVRYILTRIHKHLDSASGQEINVDTSEVHIEHIMPVVIEEDQWQVSLEIHDTYLWRLGNLMLLAGKFNQSASNKTFVEKKSKYLLSKIEPNKAVCGYSQWSPVEIECRQNELAKYALEIWK